MKRSLIALTAAVLLTASLGVAFAQETGGAAGQPGQGQGRGGGQGRRGGMMGRGGGGLRMLRQESVQKELKMTQFQIDKLDAKQQEVQGKMRDLMQNAGDPQSMSPEDRQKLGEKMQALQNQAVADILDTTQLQRFHQLELQQQGASALSRKEVADKLHLTDQQRTQIGDIQKQSMADMRAATQGKDFQNMSDEDRQKLMTQMRDMRKATDEKITGVLNESQKKQWKEMLGKPFEFGPPPGRQGGGA